MKRFSQLVLTILLFTLSISYVQAQNDTIFKTDGTEMVGKVLSIDDTDINFTYKSETIKYKVQKYKISKIIFASGRVEFYNDPSELKGHHNKVAILPFTFIKNQNDGSDAMSKMIQQETYSIFNAKRGDLTFQDVMTTNRLLSQAGIGDKDVQNYSMNDICYILGVEYAIEGLVSVVATSQSSYSDTSVNVKTNNKKPAKTFVGKLLDDSGTNVTSDTYNSTSQNYSTTITMNIYNDQGDNIFSKDHQSFWQTEDAYKITLNYLAKRTPFYTK